MKALLMFPDKDFDERSNVAANKEDLSQDLELQTLFASMANEDEFLLKIVSAAILSSSANDKKTVQWRQDILKDCLNHEDIIRSLYAITLEPIQIRKSMFLISSGRHPSLMLSDGRRTLEAFLPVLKKLYNFAAFEKERFQSAGLGNLCSMLVDQLAPDYLAEMKQHLLTLRFESGLLFSARLGNGNTGTDFVPRFFVPQRWLWLKEWLGETPAHYRFSLDPRDESGARELSELRDDVLKDISISVFKASKHVEAFFNMLRCELAFYIGCLNLRRVLKQKNCPTCMPVISDTPCTLMFDDLRDPSLSLALDQPAVGNSLEAKATPLILITGANQGGKSTFLRSLGVSQLMFQAGMFVAAQQYEADLRDGVFTHYRRREDKDLNSGKFDEELFRMNEIVKQLGKSPFLLFNESFAATNEREGAEVARQIIAAVIQSGGRVVFVTHMYAMAESFKKQSMIKVCFLRAERDELGRRSFKIFEGDPAETSFGKDLYLQIFKNFGLDS